MDDAPVIGTIVMPVLNEAAGIDAALVQLLAVLDAGWQVVVVDGGSSDGTVEHLKKHPVHVLVSEPGRAQQMNEGAWNSKGEIIVFLHSDTRIPRDFCQKMAEFNASDHHWGRFNVALDQQGWPFKMLGWFINQRSRLTGVCTGDQTLFVRRPFFESLNGYAKIPLMEDVEFSLRARRIHQPYCINEPVRTSARRWLKHGIVKTVLLMWWLRLAFRLGVNPQRLHRWYYGSRVQ